MTPLRLVPHDTDQRRYATHCLRVATTCLRFARQHPQLADVYYPAAWRWLVERQRVERGGR